jgi:hypothetical protein
MALPPMRAQGFRARLQDLYDAAAHNRPDEVFEYLSDLVPEYSHSTRRAPALAGASIYPDDY